MVRRHLKQINNVNANRDLCVGRVIHIQKKKTLKKTQVRWRVGGGGVAGEQLINNLLSERLCLPPSASDKEVVLANGKRTDQQPIHVPNKR